MVGDKSKSSNSKKDDPKLKSNEKGLKWENKKTNIKAFFNEYYIAWVIIIWYSTLLYLFFAYIFESYTFKTYMFSFSSFLIYEVIIDDFKDTIIEIISNK